MFFFRLASVIAGLGISAASAATPSPERLVIFGDSLSDTGNISAMTNGVLPGEPYWEGRFSNGPVWVEELAVQFELNAPDCSICGGTNFAFGGARTGTGFTNFIIPDIGRQVAIYFEQGFAPQPGDLFVILGGNNDFFMGETDASPVVNNLSNRIITLAQAGATDFLVLNLPPLGQTPGNLGTPQEALLDAVVESFNDAFGAALDSLESALGIQVQRFDLHHEFQAIIDDPAAFGLIVVDLPAYYESSGYVVPNPESYLFWDDVHPTATVHAALGRRVHGRMTCPADVNGDGTVGVDDLVALLLAYGESGFAVPEDVVQSGQVDVDDLVAVITAWGACP